MSCKKVISSYISNYTNKLFMICTHTIVWLHN